MDRKYNNFVRLFSNYCVNNYKYYFLKNVDKPLKKSYNNYSK